jgi:energy-coupling factor transporter ATP-binding protein EcfA2
VVYEPVVRGDSPYPGLRAFGPHERDIFFGRDDQISDLVAKLLARHFLIVTGASGCGKSSLVRTGLLNALQAHETAPGERSWDFIEFRPGTAPLWELADGLRRAVHERLDGVRDLDPGWAQQQLDLRAHLLRDGYEGLRRALTAGVYGGEPLLANGRQVLLLADQFEEIFRYGQRLADDLRARAFMEEAAALVRILLGPVGVRRNYAAGQGRAPDAVDEAIHVIVTMRTEYLDRCGEFDGLLAAINDSFAIAASLEGLNLTRAIVGPADRRGGAISSKLVDRLFDDAEGITFDRLPLLQHVLMRCWRLASDREGRPRMALEDYHDTRPLTKGKALTKHADEAFTDVEARGEGRLAEIMFRELTDRWWLDSNHPHRRRFAWAQRYGFSAEDLAQLQSYLDHASRYYQQKDAKERSKRVRRRILQGLALLAIPMILGTVGFIVVVRSQMSSEYVQDFRRDILIAHQTLQTLRSRDREPVDTIFENWAPESFRSSWLAKPIVGSDDYQLIQSTLAEVKEMANDVLSNTEDSAALAAGQRRSGERTAFVTTLQNVPTALSWTDTEPRIGFADVTGTYFWDVDSDRNASLTEGSGPGRAAEGSRLRPVCPGANLSAVKEISPVRGSAEWLLILDGAAVRASLTTGACPQVALPLPNHSWQRVIAWGNDLAVFEPTKMHRWHDGVWSSADDSPLEPEEAETVAALAGESEDILYAVSTSGRRLHWSGPHLADRWDIGFPKGAQLRKVDFGGHPRGHFMAWLEVPQDSGPARQLLLLLEGTTMVPIDQIEAPELLLWLLTSDQAVRQRLELMPAPIDSKSRELEEADVSRLVDFDYQCFGEKGCWLAAAFTGGSSAPPLLLAKWLHGTHEQ